MALSNSERQLRWRLNHPELDKQRKREWIHKERVAGRIPWNEFFTFKGKKKVSQVIGRNLFESQGNSERCEQLKAIGVEPQKWNHIGLKSKVGTIHLEQKHSCNNLCSFYGHSETWIDIEPVAYKVSFLKGWDFGKFVGKYWIFKRYLKLERRLDFPDVRPEFKCEECGFSQTFVYVEDMFLFGHKCPLPIDPFKEAWELAIIREQGRVCSSSNVVGLWSLNKLHRWIGSILPSTGFGFSISGRRLGFEVIED